MLKKITNNSLVSDKDRLRYADGSMLLTVWLNLDETIYGFELVYNLLDDEKALFYTENVGTKFSDLIEESPRTGRNVQRTLNSVPLKFEKEHLEKFQNNSSQLPGEISDFILEIMQQIIVGN